MYLWCPKYIYEILYIHLFGVRHLYIVIIINIISALEEFRFSTIRDRDPSATLITTRAFDEQNKMVANIINIADIRHFPLPFLFWQCVHLCGMCICVGVKKQQRKEPEDKITTRTSTRTTVVICRSVSSVCVVGCSQCCSQMFVALWPLSGIWYVMLTIFSENSDRMHSLPATSGPV